MHLHHLLSNFLILLVLPICPAQSSDPIYYICDDGSIASTKQSQNIDTLLPILVQGTILNGFLATSYGESSSKIYGLAQCVGYVSKQDCSSCIRNAVKGIRNLCPRQSDSRIWYDYCFLRYKTAKFFGQVDTSGTYYYNVEDVKDPDTFNAKLGTLMDEIKSKAVKRGQKELAKGKIEISNFLTLYGLVQCTRDLSEINCGQCLAIGISNFEFCNNKKGCRVLYSSCYIRYELYPFYSPFDSHRSSLVHSSDKYESIRAYGP